MQFKLSDLFRRIENLVREGPIVQADYNNALFRVQIGENTSGWLRCLTLRAGLNKSWHPPEVGENVLVLSPSGDYANGFILPALFTGNNLPIASDPNQHTWQFDDGAVIEYNRQSHHLKAILPGGATTELFSDGGVHFTGDLLVTGDITATGEVIDHTRSMQGDRDIYNIHTHGGSTTGQQQ